MSRTCYACPSCGYHGPADRRDWFPDGQIVASESWRVCSNCGAEVTRAERLDDDQHPCEVCKHAIAGDDGRCYTCAVADAFDDALCESRAVVSDLHMTIKDIVRCQAVRS
jgi:hypothetical protein